MKVLDFLYYVVYNFYKRNGENEPWIAARIVVGLFPMFNIMSIFFIIDFVSDYRIFNNAYQSFLFSIPTMLFTYYRYTKITNYTKIAHNISEYDEKEKEKLDFFYFTYAIISFILFVLLAGYIGEARNPPPFWDGWFK